MDKLSVSEKEKEEKGKTGVTQNKHYLTHPRRAGDVKFAAFPQLWLQRFDSRRRAEPDRASSFVFHTQFASVISGRGSLTNAGGDAAKLGQVIPLPWFSPPLDLSQSQVREARAPDKGRATQPLCQ